MASGLVPRTTTSGVLRWIGIYEYNWRVVLQKWHQRIPWCVAIRWSWPGPSLVCLQDVLESQGAVHQSVCTSPVFLSFSCCCHCAAAFIYKAKDCEECLPSTFTFFNISLVVSGVSRRITSKCDHSLTWIFPPLNVRYPVFRFWLPIDPDYQQLLISFVILP